jgi:SAM-dependent methyltransferase
MAGPPVSRRALLFGLGRARPADAAAAWEAGRYRVPGRRLEPAAARLVRVSEAGPGRRILDLAAGDGNVALAAARAGAEVVAVDSARRLVDSGRARSEAAGLAVDWRVGDVESLPLDDASFDCVASNFGVIHARDSRRAVDEIDRVLRPGGSVLITAWASAGLMGRTLRLAAEVEGRRPDDARPEWWGRYEGVQLAFSRFPGFEVDELSMRWEFESEDQLWEELSAPPGPLTAAAAQDDGLRDRLMQLVEPSLRRDGEHVVVDVGYVIVVAHKPEWA